MIKQWLILTLLLWLMASPCALAAHSPDAEPASAQPMAAERTSAQPVAAERTSAQPVAAERTSAQPMAAEPMKERKTGWDAPSLPFAPEAPAAQAEWFVFGQSELGRDMQCLRIGPEAAQRSILLTFATHMFEDACDFDGEYLIAIAETLMAHYQAAPPENWALYFVPCVNPDGRAEGFSNLDIGRLNANGYDINRDFPERWTYKKTKSNRTGDEPFTTAEARAIRDLTELIRPDYAVDVHGWINGVYGYYPLARAFHEAFRIDIRDYSGGGMLSQWMNTQTKGAILLELPPRPAAEGYVDNIASKMIEALDTWMQRAPQVEAEAAM